MRLNLSNAHYYASLEVMLHVGLVVKMVKPYVSTLRNNEGN